jgi:hypothetical protein
MTALRRGRAPGLLAGLALLLAGRATAYVIEARLAPHVYLGPAWFLRDPAGWSLLGWYPYGLPRP